MNIVITGANTGIGKETALVLARKNHKIILINRDSKKSRDALEEINKLSSNSDVFLVCADLSEKEDIIKSVKEVKKLFSKVDILINNAGVFKTKQEFNKDGIEITTAVNYMATVHLSNLLLPLILKSEQGRIINLTSMAYKQAKVENDIFTVKTKFSPMQQYADSKLAVILYTLKLAKELKDSNVTVNCVHPGVIATEVSRDYPVLLQKLSNMFLARVEQGAKPSVKLALDPELSDTTGAYFHKQNLVQISKKFSNQNIIDDLWNKTQNYLSI